MVKKQNGSFLILLLLIILSILLFFRNGMYIIFDKNFFNLESYLEEDERANFDYFLTTFAMINFLIGFIILYKRNFENDILSYGLFYVLLSSILRVYVQYLKLTGKDRDIKNLHRLKDINAVILFLISGFILVNIFMKN